MEYWGSSNKNWLYILLKLSLIISSLKSSSFSLVDWLTTGVRSNLGKPFWLRCSSTTPIVKAKALGLSGGKGATVSSVLLANRIDSCSLPDSSVVTDFSNLPILVIAVNAQYLAHIG